MLAPSAASRFYPHLEPDKVETENILPSFEHIRSKTIDTLYGGNRYDRSPKGSVDDEVLDLVNLINDHPSYSTLSSCSGRIVLYDPILKSETSNCRPTDTSSTHQLAAKETTPVEEGAASTGDGTAVATADDAYNNDAGTAALSSGKGGSGGWLLVSHETIDPQRLVDVCFGNTAQLSSAVVFRFEPMLLHVAAASLQKGKDLLQIVLQLGFRESGLVVTETRVTVAVRSFGLSMSIPIGTVLQHLTGEHAACLLREWAVQANQRLETNLERLDRLFKHIQQSLFRLAAEQQPRLFLSNRLPLPDLNLWGHASVALQLDEQSVDILVFGGYGRGPSSIKTGSRRSEKVLRLKRRKRVWEDQWEQVYPATTTTTAAAQTRDSAEMEQATQISFLGLTCQTAAFTAREGVAACVVTGVENKTVPLLFGGRTNPGNPLDDLLLFDSARAVFWRPFDIRGVGPSPRWGHTITSLEPSTKAVIFGGRDATSVFDDMYILSIVEDSFESSHCLWENVSTTMEPRLQPRFHHATITDDNCLFVFGGLSNHQDLLESFSMDSTRNHAFAVDLSTKDVQIVQAPCALSRFGHAAIRVHQNNNNSMIGCCLGGVSASVTTSGTCDETMLISFDLARTKDIWKLSVQSLISESESEIGIPWGPLVHHSCHLLPSAPASTSSPATIEIVSIGGGVSGFAFGDFFAPCHVQCIGPTPELEEGPSAVAEMTITGSQKDLATTSQDTVCATATTPASTPLTTVLYVHKSNAKKIKNELENRNWLNKNFRMTRATADHLVDCIAVPVKRECVERYKQQLHSPGAQHDTWMLLVQGIGEQQMLYRSSHFAASAQK